MHERNIYKHTRPDFGELAVKYPSFAKYVRKNAQGGSTIDFKDPEALRELAYTLLKRDFKIDIEIPLNHLIPTIPLRLNYVHWIEDLLKTAKEHKGDTWGIDLGCGASCIYPLLGTKLNGWNFIATDIDDENIEYAKANIERNSFSDHIKILLGEKGSLFAPVFSNNSSNLQHFAFSMCNPPFFGDKLEASGLLSRTGKRPLPKTVSTVSEHESITEGGEVSFVKCMIDESAIFKDKVSWFTSMLGKKDSLKILKRYLKEQGVDMVSTTEFYQGKTMRWGIAWSYQGGLDLKVLSPHRGKQKQKKPFMLGVRKEDIVGCADNAEVDNGQQENILDIFASIVEKKLQDLEILITNRESTTFNGHQGYTFSAKATKNTWIYSRKKRRLAEREQQSHTNVGREETDLFPSKDPHGEHPATLLTANEEGKAFKCVRNDGVEFSGTDKLSVDIPKTADSQDPWPPMTLDKSDSGCKSKEGSGLSDHGKRKRSTDSDEYLSAPLYFCIDVAHARYFKLTDEPYFVLQLNCIEGEREHLHQLYLYLKNSMHGVQLHGRKESSL